MTYHVCSHIFELCEWLALLYHTTCYAMVVACPNSAGGASLDIFIVLAFSAKTSNTVKISPVVVIEIVLPRSQQVPTAYWM